MKREVKLVGCLLRNNGYIIEVSDEKFIGKWSLRRRIGQFYFKNIGHAMGFISYQHPKNTRQKYLATMKRSRDYKPMTNRNKFDYCHKS